MFHRNPLAEFAMKGAWGSWFLKRIPRVAAEKWRGVMDGQTGLNRWWRIVGGLSMNLALGAVYAWSIFVLPIQKEFGWTRADVSIIFMVLVAVFGTTFVIAGRIQDKLGPTKVSFIGATMNAVGFFMAGYTTSIGWIVFWLGGVADQFLCLRDHLLRHGDDRYVASAESETGLQAGWLGAGLGDQGRRHAI